MVDSFSSARHDVIEFGMIIHYCKTIFEQYYSGEFERWLTKMVVEEVVGNDALMPPVYGKMSC